MTLLDQDKLPSNLTIVFNSVGALWRVLGHEHNATVVMDPYSTRC